ncbi:hypothetical protein CKO25_11085 [Thiocapsa imhoffii]|uniref:Uncharacterized protein n=1 Tax=Thiocapsa imhoffii TaxID=382777 RepID=A0A9X0WI73_9GAMM|nr:hypothetical protein [Thiocapsa imhoffii]
MLMTKCCRKNSVTSKSNTYQKEALRLFSIPTKSVSFSSSTILTTYPTFDVFGFHFKLSAGRAHDNVVLYSDVLNHALGSLNITPKQTVQSRNEIKNIIEKYDNIIVDGTEFACDRPSDDDH